MISSQGVEHFHLIIPLGLFYSPNEDALNMTTAKLVNSLFNFIESFCLI